MKLTKDDLGKFFFITESDNKGYREILRCKLVEISITEKHELEGEKIIVSDTKTYIVLKFRDEFYTPKLKDVYRTLEEVLKVIEKEDYA
jgi:hypothetical protein